MNKIEEKELEQLKELKQRTQKMLFSLGEISYNKILLAQQKENIKIELKNIDSEEKTLKEFLIQKYGDNLNINLETGEY